jgi:hypothetical protein
LANGAGVGVVESGIWTLSLPAPIFWGVLAAWIPIPPSVMAGVLIAATVYALLNHLLSLREWSVDVEEEAMTA